MFLLIGKIVVLLTATNRFNFGKHVVTGVAVFIYSVKRTFKGREKFVALQISKQISSFSFFSPGDENRNLSNRFAGLFWFPISLKASIEYGNENS